MQVTLFDKDKNTNLRQSNFLIEAKYRLTRQEFRIITVIMAMVSQFDSDFKKYQIKLLDIKNLLESTSESLVGDLKKATTGLLSKPLIITTPEKTIHLNWISSAVFANGKAFVEVTLDPELKPFLLQIKSYYTEFELRELLSLKSFYSSRLYSLIKQFGDIPKREFKLDELKGKLGCIYEENGNVVDSYPLYGNFKARVLDPAVDEIKDKTKLSISFEPKKIGKKVQGIIFTINKNLEPTKKAELPLPPENSDELDRNERTLDNVKFYFIQKACKSNPEKFFLNGQKKKWRGIADWKAAADEWEVTHKEMYPDQHNKTPLSAPYVAPSESSEITKSRNDIKFIIGNEGSFADYQYFAAKPIEKTDTGYKIIVSDPRALKYEEALKNIIKIEVK